MTVFTVHEPPSPPADRIDRAEQLVFVKDGFSWGAFLLGPVWLLANRLWWAAFVYIGILVLASLALKSLGAADGWSSLLVLGLNAIIAFEAHVLKVVKLEQEGWASLGAVTGNGIADCERRFYEGWLPDQPMLRRNRPAAPATSSEPANVSGAPADEAAHNMAADEARPMTGVPGVKRRWRLPGFFLKKS